MSIFQNSFFSWAGQVERFTNVKDTLVAAVTGKGVQSNTGNKAVDKVLATAASNPFTTAGVAAVVVNPAGALSAGRSLFTALPTSGKVAAVVAAPIAVGAVAKNPQLAVSASKAPAALSNFGSNISDLIAKPSLGNVLKVAKENPLLTTALAGGTALAVGGAVSTGIHYLNTRAVKQNTQATLESISPAVAAIPPGVGTNKYDIELAKIQADALDKQNKAQLDLAKIQSDVLSKQSQPVAAVAPTAATPTKKKTTTKKKKKVVKKKKKSSAKRKVYKRKKKKR